MDIMNHDHSMMTHSAHCPVEGCPYVAQTHAHEDEEAVGSLYGDLSAHAMKEHGDQEMDQEEMRKMVRDNMMAM